MGGEKNQKIWNTISVLKHSTKAGSHKLKNDKIYYIKNLESKIL